MARKMTADRTVGEVSAGMERLAPLRLAQPWDNVGLLVGDRSAACRRVLLCIDLAPEVLDEAAAGGCELVIAYHPPLFRPIKRLLADSRETDAIIHRAIAAGIAIYSPHTALDAAPGGTNDVLAGLCGLSGIEPFEHVAAGDAGFKLVTFVPAGQLERVASAMFAAGAGRIGDYEQCSYRVEGEGTFFGRESTRPAVGEKGRLERVAETRIEVVVPAERLAGVIAALRTSHPYEEPAFDLYPLAAEPTGGIGRVGRLPSGTTLRSLAGRLAKKTGSKVVTTAGKPGTKLGRAAVCAGAAGRLPLERPASADADVIVTGEIRHHDALAILRAGKTAIALGHWESERPVLRPLARRIAQAIDSVDVTTSRRDAPPFAWSS
jgi:dinuclear metal center YbgI/SA1388 family protein